MSDSNASRRAQDTLVLLGLLLAGLGLVASGPLLPIPMFSCIGLPVAMISALAFALFGLGLSGFEVPWPRQLAGLGAAAVGLWLLGDAYLHGLGTIAAHFLGRAGAPPLTDLWISASWLSLGSLAFAASIALRRIQGGLRPAILGGTVGWLTAAIGWGVLIVLGILGAPFGA